MTIAMPEYEAFKKFMSHMTIRVVLVRSGSNVSTEIYIRTHGGYEKQELKHIIRVSPDWIREQKTDLPDYDYQRTIWYGIADWLNMHSFHYMEKRQFLLDLVEKDDDLKKKIISAISSKIEESKYHQEHLWKQFTREADGVWEESMKKNIEDHCTFLIDMDEAHVIRLLREIRVQQVLKS